MAYLFLLFIKKNFKKKKEKKRKALLIAYKHESTFLLSSTALVGENAHTSDISSVWHRFLPLTYFASD